jgi:putative hemolysin
VEIQTVVELLVFACLLALSAFFSSSETSLFSLSPLQLEQMRRMRNPRAALVERLLSKPRQLIVTILIGNEFVNISASVISAAIVIDVLGSESKWVNLLIMVPLLLLLGEITPKTLAIRNNVAFASLQCRFIDLFARAISPLRMIVRQVSDFLITLIVGKERSRASIVTEDMVRSLAQEAVGDGVLDRKEALYINRIFDFGDKTLRDVMTPRSRISFLAASSSLEEAVRHYRRTGHTKVPVYEKNRDSVIGVLYARDLLAEPLSNDKARGSKTVAALVRAAYLVPETKQVADLFYTFRKRKLSLAVIVDEFGGVVGLITMEDLLECIFGEILSPSELLHERTVNLKKIGTHEHRIDGTMTIWQFNRMFGSKLESDSAETIGGVLLHAFGEIPREKSSIVIGEHEFEVESVADRRIAEVTVRPVPPPQTLEGSDGSVETADPSRPQGGQGLPLAEEG